MLVYSLSERAMACCSVVHDVDIHRPSQGGSMAGHLEQIVQLASESIVGMNSLVNTVA